MVRTAVGNGVGARTQRKSYARTSNLVELPRLIEIQLQSFDWFRSKGLKELFEEISPIVSFNKHLELHFGDFRFDEPKHPEEACRERDITFSAPLWVEVKLVNKDTGEISEQEVFMGDFPLMTDSGTFIVNGSERVVVSQLIRSPGVYFTTEEDRSTGRDLTGTKLIPSRGAWLEFETSKRDIISVKVDRKRKLPVTILLRAIGYGTDEEIRALFSDVDNNDDHAFIEATLERDPTANPADDGQKGIDDALLEFYKKLRPGDPPTLDNARNFLQNLLFSSRRYDLGRVGRYKLNRKLKSELELETELTTRILTNEDIVAVVRRIININNGREDKDDIDHLGNRRIKTVGELIQYQLRIGLLRMERVVRERMSIREPEQVTPLSLINIRPVVAATREFFGSSQLSQFMDQTNPLAELTHKRRLSALGPGGLRRERAGFDVRDVHYSHYGRICPIETPEGPNIGLIGYLATYGRINDYGFIETPYRRVINTVGNMVKELTRRILAQDIVDPYSGDILAKKGKDVSLGSAQDVAALYPRVVDEVREQLLSALEQEEQSRIEEFVARIGLFSSEARSQAERLKDWIQGSLGATAKEEKHLEWLDDILFIDDFVEAEHAPKTVDFFKKGREEALESVKKELKQEEKSKIVALKGRHDRSSSEATSGSKQMKKRIQKSLGKRAKNDQHLDWLDDIVSVDDIVEPKHDRLVDFCLQGRLDALQSVSDKATADIRETSQAKRVPLIQKLDALEREEQSQLEGLKKRIDRSSSEARNQAEQLQEWVQNNHGEKAEENLRLDWLEDAIIVIDEVVETKKHQQYVEDRVQDRLAALRSESKREKKEIRETMQAKQAPLHQELGALEEEEQSQIEMLGERTNLSSTEARSHAQRLKNWIQSNLGKKAKEDQHLEWVDAILSGAETVETKHEQLVDYFVQARLDSLQSVSDKEEDDVRAQIAEFVKRIDQSLPGARDQAKRLKEWIQINSGKETKEVRRLKLVDAILSENEVVETKHERLVDYFVQARLDSLQSTSDKFEAYTRSWILEKRTKLEAPGKEEERQIEELIEDTEKYSSEAGSQAQQLKEWIQSNLGKPAREDLHLNLGDAAVIVVDEIIKEEHEQNVNAYLEARLATLQSEAKEKEAYIRVAGQAERIDELTGDKKDGEVLPKLDEGIAAKKDLIDAMRQLKEFRVRPFVSEEVIYLNADTEERSSIAQASTPLDTRGHFLNPRPSVRQADDFRFEEPQRIQFMDVSPKQVVGVSAALIPFLEHDDTNRALMGSNMQRQAVPLVQPEAPIVGTGMEWQAAVDSGQVVVARKAGEAVRVVNTEVVIQEDDGEQRAYPLRKYNRSNQSTCIDQRPTVQKGDRVEAGTVLADSSSTQNGELALGQNVLVAYMSWEGGNYEDAILVSERLVENGKYTSVHIEKHEIEARETKLGPEEITRDIPNVGEDALRHLDEDGIIRIGAEVAPGDILVGKITPKGETELTPEEKLLRAIFGEKAREVKDSSLRLPHGERGKVVDIKVFTRDDHQDMPAGVEKMVRVSIAQRRRLTEGDKMAGRHGNKGVISRVVPVEDMPFLEDGTPIDVILNPLGVPGRMNIGQVLETHLGWAADRLGFMAETPVFDGAQEDEIESELARAWLIDRAWQDVTHRTWASVREQEIESEALADDSDARRIYLHDWLEPRGYDPEELFFDDIYARNAALTEWLQDKGYEAERVVPEERSEASDLYARHVALREWMSYHGIEADGLDGAALEEAAQLHSDQVGWPLPTTGKQKLFDGKTGEPYDADVTVGIAQMLKLHHLVEDKVHARSTGPYSLVTQQPLGGKAQFGGQRFGEMEVWALEAYGAAYTLQEMLTIKSDDTTGRVKTYEAIVKGDEIQSPGVPESFRVLVKELQSLALSIEVINDKDEVIQLGKDETEERLPHLGFSLNVPSPMSRSSE